MKLLEQLRALLRNATPGPWKHDLGNADVEGPRPGRAEVCVRGEHGNYHANLELIAATRNALPLLLDVVETVARFRDDPEGEGWDEVRAALDRLDAQ